MIKRTPTKFTNLSLGILSPKYQKSLLLL